MSDVTILGAGVAGLCCATELAARGARVQIIDPAGGPGAQGCSWWAGGMLAPWCESETAPPEVLRLGQEAIGWWQARTEVHQHGTLVVAHGRDAPDLRRFARRTGAPPLQDVAALEPDLSGFDRGLFYAAEAHLNPRQALRDLAQALAGQGVPILPEGDLRGTIVDCRGMAAREALPDLRGVRGEMLVLRCPDVTLHRPVRLLHPRIPLYVVPRGDGVFMLGATMIESESRRAITARSVLELLSAAYALCPGFAEAEVIETGVDLRPAFPDNLPRVQRRGGVIYANGLYRHGYLMAPALARAVADLALDAKMTELTHADHP